MLFSPDVELELLHGRPGVQHTVGEVLERVVLLEILSGCLTGEREGEREEVTERRSRRGGRGEEVRESGRGGVRK